MVDSQCAGWGAEEPAVCAIALDVGYDVYAARHAVNPVRAAGTCGQSAGKLARSGNLSLDGQVLDRCSVQAVEEPGIVRVTIYAHRNGVSLSVEGTGKAHGGGEHLYTAGIFHVGFQTGIQPPLSLTHSASEGVQLLCRGNEYGAVLSLAQGDFLAMLGHVFFLCLHVGIHCGYLLVAERFVIDSCQGNVARKHAAVAGLIPWIKVATHAVEACVAVSKSQVACDSAGAACQLAVNEELHGTFFLVPHAHQVYPFVCHRLRVVHNIVVASVHVHLEVI